MKSHRQQQYGKAILLKVQCKEIQLYRTERKSTNLVYKIFNRNSNLDRQMQHELRENNSGQENIDIPQRWTNIAPIDHSVARWA